MKIDLDYLKGLLEAFQAAPKPTTNIQELRERGFDHENDRFWFHMKILEDKGLIKNEKGFGLGYSQGINGDVMVSVVPLRLTADGHDFLEALRNKTVWAKIKSNFQEVSIDTLVEIAKELLKQSSPHKSIEVPTPRWSLHESVFSDSISSTLTGKCSSSRAALLTRFSGRAACTETPSCSKSLACLMRLSFPV